MSNFFEINNLQVGFKTFEGEKPVLDIEHLAIQRGETYGIVGESGSGKTVLALAIQKLLPDKTTIVSPKSEIRFDGVNLLNLTEKEIRNYRGTRIAMIFQDPMSTLNPVFTVGHQIIRVIRTHNKISKKEAEREALRLVELVRLPDAANILSKYPHELSGGQRQRIIIAIALSCKAEFLIADEPTRNLDVTIQAGVLKLIAELQRDLDITVLYLANNLGLVATLCDRIGILYEGKIVENGLVRDVLDHPKHEYTQKLLRLSGSKSGIKHNSGGGDNA